MRASSGDVMLGSGTPAIFGFPFATGVRPGPDAPPALASVIAAIPAVTATPIARVVLCDPRMRTRPPFDEAAVACATGVRQEGDARVARHQRRVDAQGKNGRCRFERANA